MKIVIVSATAFEIAPLHTFLQQHFQEKRENEFHTDKLQVSLLVTGVGATHTALALGQYLTLYPVNLAINAGIAGSFNRNFSLGDVLNVHTERWGDLGAEDENGNFLDAFQLKLIDPNAYPYTAGVLHNKSPMNWAFLPSANGLTVNKVHGFQPHIERLQNKFNVDVETMEGAAFFLACLKHQVAFLELRAISNYVEPRNRDNWKIEAAISNLNRVLEQIMTVFLEDS